MARAKPLPEELAARSFTIGEGRLSGISPWRAKAKDIHVPSRGIRVPVGPRQSLLERVRPYTELGTPDTVSYYSAAAVHTFKLPGSLAEGRSTTRPGLLHLTRAGSAAPRRKGVVGHRATLEPADIVILQGVPVTSISRTLLDLAGTGALTLEDLVVIADDLVCEHVRYLHPRTARMTLEELQRYTGSRRRGTQKCPRFRVGAEPGALFAEGKRFELLVRGYRTLVFKTSSFGRSDNLP
jgi:uncharacterized short protein YbdD (DUF466 family)